MLTLIFLAAAFVLLSGLMAAVDAAVLSVTRPEVHELLEQRKRGARSLLTVKSELTGAVVVIVILTNTVNVLGPVIVSQQAVATFGTTALGAVTVGLTLGTIVFSEIIPKSVGTRYATVIGRMSAPPIRVLQTVLYPLVIVLEWLSGLFTRGNRRIGTEEQIRSLATIGRQAGFIEHDESHLIHRAFLLNDRTAADIMTARDEVVAISGDRSVREALVDILPSGYSRFPVFDESPDTVIGMALVRDILEAVVNGRGEEPVRGLLHPVFRVDAGERSDELLLRFRDRHVHLAVVTDRGRTVGVVTLEDVLEELVGEIEDERDVVVRGILPPASPGDRTLGPMRREAP